MKFLSKRGSRYTRAFYWWRAAEHSGPANIMVSIIPSGGKPRTFILPVISFVAFLLMAGCGQKGDLYLPSDKPEPTETADSGDSQSPQSAPTP